MISTPLHWQRLIAAALLCIAGGLAHADQAKTLDPAVISPGIHAHPSWFKQSFLDLGEDVKEATAAGKRVVLYFYQDGCPYCKKLIETNFALKDIADKTRNNFDVIALDLWGSREVTNLDGDTMSEKEFAETMKVMYTPTLVFLNEQGKTVLRMNGYYPPHKFALALDYVAGHHETEQSIQDYFAQKSPPAAVGKLHQDPTYLQPPYDLSSRDSDKPLLVMFEQKECPPCDELHLDILKRKESQELLKHFDVALLDMWSDMPVVTPGGQAMAVKDWAKALKVQYAPTLVFFVAGSEVFRSEAYLKAFHTQSVLDYVASGAYREQPNFQRYIQTRADALEAQGVHIDLMK